MTSAGFIVALVTAFLKGEVEESSLVAMLGCVCGAVGLLVLALGISREGMMFVRASYGYAEESE